MADIYEPNFMKNDALNQYFRTTRQLSGKAPRKSILQDIIGSEVDKAAANWRAANAQRIQQQQFNTTFGENQRQFNVGQQNAADTAAAQRKAAETQGIMNLTGQLGSSYLLYRGLKPSTPVPPGGAESPGIVDKYITNPVKEGWNKLFPDKPDVPAENLSDIPPAQPEGTSPYYQGEVGPGGGYPATGIDTTTPSDIGGDVNLVNYEYPTAPVQTYGDGVTYTSDIPSGGGATDVVTIAGEETLAAPAATELGATGGATGAAETTLAAPVGQTATEFSAGTGEMLGAAETGLAATEGGATVGGAVGGVMPYAWIPAAAIIGGKLLESAGGGYDRQKDSGTTAARVGASMQNVWQGPGPTSTEILFGKNYAGGATDTLNTVQDVLNPGGFIARAAGCAIIMTAIHGSDSPKVNLCREYRDKFLTDEQLRGYYVFAEPVCFIMEKHPGLKRYFRKYLTDSFVDYAKYRLGERMTKPSLKSSVISRVFLKLCSYLGRKVPVYTRLNGEVY